MVPSGGRGRRIQHEKGKLILFVVEGLNEVNKDSMLVVICKRQSARQRKTE